MSGPAADEAAIDLIGLGELLWDRLPSGDLPGGAPANVAYHAKMVGLDARVATRVGCDMLGDRLIEFLTGKGLQTDLVQRDPIHGTGTVDVTLNNGQASYVFKPDSAWDFLELTDGYRTAFRSARAIVFGTLAQREPTSRQTIQQLLRCVSPECLVTYDINLRPPFISREVLESSLALARLVKMNDDEALSLGDWFSAKTPTLEDAARFVWDHSPADWVCITRGANGAALYARDGSTWSVPGIQTNVVDTVGAGDAFTASLVAGRLKNWSPEASLTFANRLGSLVASGAGAMPDITNEVSRMFDELNLR